MRSLDQHGHQVSPGCRVELLGGGTGRVDSVHQGMARLGTRQVPTDCLRVVWRPPLPLHAGDVVQFLEGDAVTRVKRVSGAYFWTEHGGRYLAEAVVRVAADAPAD